MSESSSSDDDDAKTTEINPNFAKLDNCKCGKGCKTRSCNCFKFGSGCNPSCGCTSSCTNMFNQLSYFFGDNLEENKNCHANPCFAKWLVTNSRDSSALQQIDRDNLRDRIMASGKWVTKLSSILNSKFNVGAFFALATKMYFTTTISRNGLRNGIKSKMELRLTKNWHTLKSISGCFYRADHISPSITIHSVTRTWSKRIASGIALNAKNVKVGDTGTAGHATSVSIYQRNLLRNKRLA